MSLEEQEARLAELVEGFLEKVRRGESVRVEEYAAAYPDVEEELLQLLPAMEDMEQLNRSSQHRPVSEVAFPESLGGYRLVKKIGSGGMGVVFQAVQESLHREVAVKILSPSWNAEAKRCEAFENESRLIAGLRHTNIVEVFGAGQEAGFRYYVMSLVQGQGVSAGRLGRAFPGIPYDQAVARVGLQAARALSFAHQHGVLHRDVKPSNLLLDDEGVVHVSDFGLATVLNSGEDTPLVTQSHDGTLRYMAPERLSRGINSFAGDQYALGLTLYELLLRRPAFRESEPGSLIHRICSQPLSPLQGKGELGAIVNKSISFEEKNRYASMEEMADDLQRCLCGEPVLARPAPWLRRYVLWVHRRPAVAIWSHVAALLVLLLFASVTIGYARVRQALTNENEQRVRAEKNAQIADSAMERIFSSMVQPGREGERYLQPTRADARLIQDLLPYYEEIVSQADSADDKVARACRILATIALQTADDATAEQYFRRSMELSEPNSLAYVQAVNGLASALLFQHSPQKVKEACRTLEGMVMDFRERKLDYETRLELVRSLLMLRVAIRPGGTMEQRMAVHRAASRGAARGATSDSAEKWLLHAAQMLDELLVERPDNIQARLLQVEMLATCPLSEIQHLLAPRGEKPLALLEGLLQRNPELESLQRAYVRLALSPPFGGISWEEKERMLPRAAAYVQSLLTSFPSDSELIMNYIAVRNQYTASLQRQGHEEEARREHERTLGVLALLTSRADFSPELRERLVLLVGMQPRPGKLQEQQEEEIMLLLESCDEKRRNALRQRLQKMRKRVPPYHRLHPRRPGRRYGA